MRIAVLYALFAMLATASNIGAQELSLRLYAGEHAITLSILVGTAVGLLTKFVLDKRYIFRHRSESMSADTRVFVLYTLTGIGTTAIFWGCELLFHLLFEGRAMRYLGGVIGLAIGYLIKYRLDRRFVFSSPRPPPPEPT
ncbi:MAG: GtrA family protein [Gammaproteobacteria bacterium]|nr:GtrA family protein [Gammaproteobacteria bacterium]